MKSFYNISIILVLLIGCQQQTTEQVENKKTGIYKPEKDLEELFHVIQMAGVYEDSKTFVDCNPKKDPAEIVKDYRAKKDSEGFDIKQFVIENFEAPSDKTAGMKLDESPDLATHLDNHWAFLTRSADSDSAISSLLSLPEQYIVPGGRFREIYYWDSYFTMLGLLASGEEQLVVSMVDNFAYLIDEVGFIPNGNRSYYLGRSQPPFFSSMVSLVGKAVGEESAIKYLPQLEKEYAFWMEGSDQLSEQNKSVNHVVWLDEATVLNRYWDKFDTPRPESYKEDVELAEESEEKKLLYRNLRAGAASGWDYSTRWFADKDKFETIRTSEIIPVDLNCLLYKSELTIAELAKSAGDTLKANDFIKKAKARKQAILNYCWDASNGYFTDYVFTDQTLSPYLTLAGNFPLYYNISTDEQAKKQAESVMSNLLEPGGLSTTTNNSGQQWDLPNGWAPLQWISIKGFEHYGMNEYAADVESRWIRINEKVYATTGKMMEKYNVVDTSLIAGGGEYPTQDGFGWTNGVALALIKDLEIY